MRMQRREGPGSSGAGLQWDRKDRLALARLHVACSLPSEGEAAEDEPHPHPVGDNTLGPCLGFARGAALTESVAVASALHLVCPARRLLGSEKLPPGSSPQPRPRPAPPPPLRF